MSKLFFRLLIVLMSLSLIGIILVQVYWFNTSFQNNNQQFGFHVKQVMNNVAEKLEKHEAYLFYDKYNHYKDSTGKIPQKKDLLEFFYVQKNAKTNQTIVYSNSIIAEDYGISSAFFDRKKDSIRLKNFTSKRVTEVFNNSEVDKTINHSNTTPDIKSEKTGNLDVLDNAQFEIFFKDVAGMMAIEERLTVSDLQKILDKEIKEFGITTPYQFGVYENEKLSNVKSEKFEFDAQNSYPISIFSDNEGNSKYKLVLSFPCKKRFLLSELVGITILSIVFTLVIVIAYASALNQLIRQRQISEIKTDFINNMTHEFKTPIATINLALDAIRNPKIIDDKEKVQRYLQMIRDENKRMHAQVENVLQISKLERREVDLDKEENDIHDIIDEAVEHVSLILEDRHGKLTKIFNAQNSMTMLNDMHFTNVLVNILDNAIKYSPNPPEIEITTENTKQDIIIRIKDHGVGMSKIAQKKIFEKFYREHTGDIHNVKGHGLGLSYVKKIVDEHHGQISVESEKGKGSIFIIKLPLKN